MPVLAGANGATFTFGPGHLDGTAAPGTPGHSVIAGHRDTSFTLPGNLRPDDPVSVQGRDRFWRDYRVTGTAVADARLPWHIPALAKGKSSLTLVPCAIWYSRNKRRRGDCEITRPIYQQPRHH